MIHRLIINWVYGGFLAGLLLVLLAPLFVHEWPPALAAAFFCLPAYMLHQYEEHDNDRFRIFMNRILANGHDALTLPAVFIINVPGVWGVIALSLWLAFWVNPGLALIAVYLPLINALIHIAHASSRAATILVSSAPLSCSCLFAVGACLQFSAPAMGHRLCTPSVWAARSPFTLSSPFTFCATGESLPERRLSHVPSSRTTWFTIIRSSSGGSTRTVTASSRPRSPPARAHCCVLRPP